MKAKWLWLLLIPVIAWLCIRTEIDFGRVLDEDGNGRVYNRDPFYNYISYEDVDASENDIVMTVSILNPFNTYEDDIIKRIDYVILSERRINK